MENSWNEESFILLGIWLTFRFEVFVSRRSFYLLRQCFKLLINQKIYPLWLSRIRIKWTIYKIELNKYERNLRLVTHIFTKLSQSMCLISTHILIYRNSRCDCKLWNVLWFHSIFIHICRPFMFWSVISSIFIKLLLIVCLID